MDSPNSFVSCWGRTSKEVIYFFFFFFFFLFFLGYTLGIWKFPGLGSNWNYRYQPTQLYHSHSNPDLSCICNLYHGSQQCLIINPLSEVRDRTLVLMATTWVHYHGATTWTPWSTFEKVKWLPENFSSEKILSSTAFLGGGGLFPWPSEVPRPGNEPTRQQWQEPQQWQYQILNLLHHQGTPAFLSLATSF